MTDATTSSGTSGAAGSGTSTGTGSGEATSLQAFTTMSAVLTGFQESFISPSVDPINLTQAYLNMDIAQVGQELVDLLISEFLALAALAGGQTLSAQAKQQIANELLATASTQPPTTALLARSIVKMWYLGIWYPFVPPSPSETTPGSIVVSSNAYIGGLAWSAAQAHPMGYSTFKFGYWNQAPSPLSQFGVDTLDGGSNG